MRLIQSPRPYLLVLLCLAGMLFASLTVPAQAQTARARLNARRLPPTRLDSFVYQAGGMAEQIYGDEGVGGLPPIFGFNAGNRIDAGIQGVNAQGITTGHGSVMPAAWGDGYEMCMSGRTTPQIYPVPNDYTQELMALIDREAALLARFSNLDQRVSNLNSQISDLQNGLQDGTLPDGMTPAMANQQIAELTASRAALGVQLDTLNTQIQTIRDQKMALYSRLDNSQ